MSPIDPIKAPAAPVPAPVAPAPAARPKPTPPPPPAPRPRPHPLSRVMGTVPTPSPARDPNIRPQAPKVPQPPPAPALGPLNPAKPGEMNFHLNPSTPKPRMPRAHVSLRAAMGVLSMFFAVQHYFELKRLAKDPEAKGKDYIAPAGGLGSTGVEFGSLFVGGALGTGLAVLAGVAGTGFSWWGEGNREDDVVEKFLYPALLNKDTQALNELIGLSDWLGHIVDDDVLTKLFAKVEKEKPEILSRENKEWDAWWKAPERKYFRDSAIGRVEYGFMTGSDAKVAIFLNQSAIDFENPKKENYGYLYDLVRLNNGREDKTIENPYNPEHSLITLRDLRAKATRRYEDQQQAPAPQAETALPSDSKPAEVAAPAPVPPLAIEDAVKKAKTDIVEIKELRKKNKTGEAIKLANTLRGELKGINTPEAIYLKGTALALIGTMHYEVKNRSAKKELTDALRELQDGQLKDKVPYLELGFVHFGLARVATEQNDETEAISQYRLAAQKYKSTTVDKRYTADDRKAAIGNLSDIYYALGVLVLPKNREDAKEYFKSALNFGKKTVQQAETRQEKEDGKSLIKQANEGIKAAEE